MTEEELALVDALRSGDEAAFSSLVARYHATMVRVAKAFVNDHAAAEDVAQDAWLGILRGLAGYEGRSLLRTWIIGIVMNQAKSKAAREHRSIPLSSLTDVGDTTPSVEPDRFLPSDHAKWPRWWDEYPRRWDDIPEARLMARETRGVVERAIEALPEGQRVVITLRDIGGLTGTEVCSILVITETNQRVLLHRARASVRKVLERYFEEESA